MFVFSFLEQEVAGGLSSAFTGCSGLANILDGLEGRTAPTKKPQAIKRKFASKAASAAKAKAKPKAKPKAKAAAVEVIEVIDLDAPEPKAKAKAVAKAVAKAAAVEAAPKAKAVPKDTRKCVHSRAYKKAVKANENRLGVSKLDVSRIACKAAKAAAEQWDRDHEGEVL